MPEIHLPRIINAAGHLSMLGGGLSPAVVADEVGRAITEAMRQPVDMAWLKDEASRRISAATGAEAGCVTTGAAAAIALSVAACITGTDPAAIRNLPAAASRVVLQAGHDIDFGAPIVQMVRLGGGAPDLAGSADAISEADIIACLPGAAACLFVQSHHVTARNRIPLSRCIALAHAAGVPLILDAAAEEDLRGYIGLGVDLVIYSGGKALGGLSSSGLVAGKTDLIQALRAQERGIGRAMKVGPEQLLSVCISLALYGAEPASWKPVLEALRVGTTAMPCATFSIAPDEAGRPIERLQVETSRAIDVCAALRSGSPPIYVRAHHASEGRFSIDPRNLAHDDVPLVLAALERVLRAENA